MTERRFDHDKARELFADGKTLTEISRQLGVSRTSIRRAVSQEAREIQKKYQKNYKEKKTQTVKHNNVLDWKNNSESRTFVLGISVTPRMYKIVDNEASRQGKAKSIFLLEIIEDYFEQNGITPRKSKGWRKHDGASGETRTPRDARQNPDHPE